MVRTGPQRSPKALAAGNKTAMDFFDISKFAGVDLIQRRLNRLNLQHAIGNNFTFELV